MNVEVKIGLVLFVLIIVVSTLGGVAIKAELNQKQQLIDMGMNPYQPVIIQQAEGK